MKERISLNVRLFLVTMCIAVPVIAALLFTGIRERESARNEKINQLQSDVEIEMSGIDTQLKFLRNSLINLVMDDGDFRHIASAKEKDSEFWLANQRVLEKINSQTADMDSGFTVFVYYPENDVFYNYMKDIQVSDFVKEQVQSKDYISRFSQWSTVWCGEKAYLFFMLDYNNYYIGAWSSYENIAADLQQSSGNFQDGEGAEKYLICDENGQVMVPDEEKETWLSFGENIYTEKEKGSWYYAGTISELADFYLVKEIKKQALECLLSTQWWMKSISMPVLVS